MKKLNIKTIFICVIIFVFFLLVTFPFKNLSNYIYTQVYNSTGVILLAEDLYFTFWGWPGIAFTNVSASIPIRRSMTSQNYNYYSGSEVNLKCQKLILRIGIGSLFPFAPSISLKISDMEKGGNVYIKFYNNKKSLSLVSSINTVQLAQLEIPNHLDMISGIISANADVFWDFESPTQSKGLIKINIHDFSLPSMNFQGISLPKLDMGKILGLITIQNGVVSVNNLQIENNLIGLKGSINGEVRLANNIYQSYIVLTVKFILSEEMLKNPNYATFISFLSAYERRPGDYGLRWSSTLQDISTNLMYALPQKIMD